MVLNEKTYVEKAEEVIKVLLNVKDKKGYTIKLVTTSKIRNILSMTADIYNDVIVMDEKLSDEINSRIDYLRVRCIYEAGRDSSVKVFMEKANIIEALKEIKGSRARYILFQRYIEALVAFHKFNGGQD